MAVGKFKTIFTNSSQDKETYIIAEISANHGASLEKGLQITELAKEAGADCIKTQVYRADTITINANQPHFQITKGAWKNNTLYSLYEQAYTPWEWQKTLKEAAEKIGLDYLATPFDESAVDLLEELNIGFYKIASAEITHIPLINYIAKTGKPIILSTGMASLAEIEEAIATIKACGNSNIALLKCSSVYPAVYEDLNLTTIPHLSKAFNVPAGFSDHSLGATSAIVAVALGAQIIEKHLCINNSDETADAFFSLDGKEFKKMVEEIRNAEKAIGEISYATSPREEASKQYRRSIMVAKPIAAGELFTTENIKVVRPSNGLKPRYYKEILGQKATHNLSIGDPLQWRDIVRGE